jgi:hypothetical protein
MKWPEFPSVLQDKTLILLDAVPRKITYQMIATETGLSPQWIADFHSRRLKHCSVGRVETLYNYLSPIKLEV